MYSMKGHDITFTAMYVTCQEGSEVGDFKLYVAQDPGDCSRHKGVIVRSEKSAKRFHI